MAPQLDAPSVTHRPWPVPTAPWAMHMTWHDLVFLHWPVDSAILRPHIPSELSVDTFDGSAWLGVVPFRMSGVRPRFVPPLPGVSAFPELNLRTYVTIGGKPGVWFFSLDVTKRLAVRVARSAFHLPYFRAHMEVERVAGGIHYLSRRAHPGAPSVGFAGRYAPSGPVFQSTAGSLEAWLTERYCLYSANGRGRVYRGDIHHAPWPLQEAEVEIERNDLAAPIGVAAFDGPPLAHFARELDVVAWRIRQVV